MTPPDAMTLFAGFLAVVGILLFVICAKAGTTIERLERENADLKMAVQRHIQLRLDDEARHRAERIPRHSQMSVPASLVSKYELMKSLKN